MNKENKSKFELLKSYGKFKEHFKGYKKLRCVTYCNSPEKILELLDDLSYDEVEVFVGDKRSSDYRENLIGKAKIADRLEELKQEGKLKIYTLEEKGRSDVHSKQYILEDEEGNVKLICGSPNLTKSGWGGNQKNTIVVIECTKNSKEYENWEDIYETQVEDYGELFLKDLTKLIENRSEEKERKDVIEEWLEGKKSTKDGMKELYNKITEEATSESEEEKIKISTMGYDDRDIKNLKEETKDFGGSLSGKSFEIPKQGINKLYRERYKLPIMRVKENDIRFMVSDKSESLIQKPPRDSDKINKELKKFERYFKLVEKYGKTKDLLGIQSHMFEALLFFFWSPFAHIQAKYYRNNEIENITKHIPFLYIYGESNAGKGTLAKYGLRLI